MVKFSELRLPRKFHLKLSHKKLRTLMNFPLYMPYILENEDETWKGPCWILWQQYPLFTIPNIHTVVHWKYCFWIKHNFTAEKLWWIGRKHSSSNISQDIVNVCQKRAITEISLIRKCSHPPLQSFLFWIYFSWTLSIQSEIQFQVPNGNCWVKMRNVHSSMKPNVYG